MVAKARDDYLNFWGNELEASSALGVSVLCLLNTKTTDFKWRKSENRMTQIWQKKSKVVTSRWVHSFFFFFFISFLFLYSQSLWKALQRNPLSRFLFSRRTFALARMERREEDKTQHKQYNSSILEKKRALILSRLLWISRFPKM